MPAAAKLMPTAAAAKQPLPAAAPTCAGWQPRRSTAWHPTWLLCCGTWFASGDCPQARLQEICGRYADSLQLLYELGSVQSWEELGAWVEAAEPCLQLLPLLSQLHAAWSQELLELRETHASKLAASLVDVVWYKGACSAYDWATWSSHEMVMAAAAAAPEQLLRQLCQLHSTGCRLVHWLAAGGGSFELLGRSGTALDWYFLQYGLSVGGLATADLLLAAAEAAGDSRCAPALPPHVCCQHKAPPIDSGQQEEVKGDSGPAGGCTDVYLCSTDHRTQAPLCIHRAGCTAVSRSCLPLSGRLCARRGGSRHLAAAARRPWGR